MGLLHSVGVVLHPTRMNADAIGTLLAWAEAADLPVYGLPDEVGRMDCAALPVAPEQLAERSSLLVSLGGDGTMLRTMRLLPAADAGARRQLRPARVPRRGRPARPARRAGCDRRGTVHRRAPRRRVRAAASEVTRSTTSPWCACPGGGLAVDRGVRRGLSVRPVRRRRGHRGDTDGLHGVQLLRRRADRVAERRRAARHPGRTALGVQPGADAVSRRGAAIRTSCVQRRPRGRGRRHPGDHGHAGDRLSCLGGARGRRGSCAWAGPRSTSGPAASCR